MRGLRVMLRRSSRVDHERLLDAARAGRSPTPGSGAPLAELLRAAAAPARDRELAGEEAAAAAFRTAQRQKVADPVTRRRRHRLTVGALAWIAGVVATATAGAALAAVGLDRSGPTPPPAVTSPAAPEPTTAPGTPTGGPSDTPPSPTAPTDGPTAGATSVPPTPRPSASPAPSPEATSYVGPGNSDNTTDRPGLCRAYLAKSERQREKALSRPAYHELVVAAGGAEHVEEYCQNLRAESESDSTTSPD